MGKLIGRRLVRGIGTLILLSIIAFTVTHILPGDPARAILGPEPDSASVAKLHKALGLDDPLPVQYWHWATAVLHGDLGKSYRAGFSVSSTMRTDAPPTVELSVLALLFGVAAGIPLGLAGAYWHNRWPDRLSTMLAAIGIALPSFWVGMVLIVLFGVVWHVLPVYGFVPISESVGGNLKSVALPVVALGLVNAAVLARFTRSGMVEVLLTDYIRTARAKGLRERRVVWGHAIRNAIVVPMTVAGLIIGYTVGGVVAIEFLFSIPGLGKLAVDSVLGREYAIVQAIMVISGALVVLANLAVDIGYELLDPRLRSS
jgi:peptide/nickel transport system permease protein